MPFKDPQERKARQKEYSKRWYEKNRAKHIASGNKNRREKREDWIAYKSEQKCSHCGAQHPAIIDFHHVIRDATKQSVNKLVGNGRWKAAKKEAQTKCIPLCANCHRVLHWDEEQEAKKKRRKKRKLKTSIKAARSLKA
jgi:predicted HNH restriction endonuclease